MSFYVSFSLTDKDAIVVLNFTVFCAVPVLAAVADEDHRHHDHQRIYFIQRNEFEFSSRAF